MTTGALVGVGLAVLASLALNGSYLAQHRGSRGAPPVSARTPVATLRGLLSSRIWLIGSIGGLLGWGLHVLALSKAPLSLVQAFSVGGLALVVPVAGRIVGVGVGRRERRAVLAMAGALALLGLGAGSAAAAVPHAGLAGFLAVCAVGAVALAAVPARGRRGAALGAAAGVLYGAADTATKAATAVVHTSGGVGVLAACIAAVAVASIGAFFCFQRGLQLGPAIPVISLMTAATTIVAITGGLSVFSEPLGATPALAALHALALTATAAAAWRLSGAQARIADAAAHATDATPGSPRRPAHA
jgi:hypothetical protein